MTEESKIPSIKLKTDTNSGPTWGGTKVDILVEGLDGFDEDTVLFSTVKFGEIEAPKPYRITKKNEDTDTVREFSVTSPLCPPDCARKVDVTLITPGGTVIARKAVVSSVQPHLDLVPVVIRGNYFKKAKVEAVKFGEERAIWFEVKSESEIWALAPKWAISDLVTLEMKHDTGEDDTTFTYNDPEPTPTSRSAPATQRAKRGRYEVDETE
jgi:hypothetical protein